MSQTIVPPSPLPVKKWKRYANYKDSGVEWLGEIPEHWEVKRLKYVVAMNADTLPEDTKPDYVLKYIDISSVDSNGKIHNSEEMIFKNAPSRARRRAWQDDTIISTVRTYLRAIAIIEDASENLVVSTGFAVLRSLPGVQPRFLWRLVQSEKFVEKIVTRSEGVGYPAINPGTLASLAVWLPPIPEQHAIAAFLDHHTTRINTLIAKKERLIELLKEKRAALISRTVTKGLDPTVPLKDSGVEWLGEIPEHWDLKKLKYCLHSIEQGWSPACDNRKAELDEWGVLKVGCVNGTSFNAEENKALPSTTEPLHDLEIKSGDILISRANTRELLGSAALVSQVRPRLLLCDKLYRLKPITTALDVEYLILLLRSSLARFQFERDATGASNSMQNISQSIILNLITPLPALQEQQSIITYVKSETAKIDALISRIQDGIKKLKEYSTALISAAVTGKIDVRDVAEESLHGYLGEEP